MATTGKNTVTRSVAPKSLFESAINQISSACTWNQGDMLYFDTTAKILKPMDSEANGEFMCGIARQTIVSGKEVQPYTTLTNGAQAIADLAGPLYGVVAKLKLKSGDAFVAGQLVYAGPSDTDAQTVQTSGTKAVGLYQGAALTAASDSVGEVLIGARYPADTLQF